MLLTRPNALSVVLFVVVELLLNWKASAGRLRLFALGLALLFCLAAAVFYLPYFLAFLDASSQITYLGIRQSDYLMGILPTLPAVINKPLSWIALAGIKTLYFCGLRPSYADTPLALVGARAVVGLILLPGLIYCLVAGERSMRLMIICFALPLFAGATQERYNLPFQPLLFYYGALFYNTLWPSCLKILKSVSAKY